jgi:hypothetical protein
MMGGRMTIVGWGRHVGVGTHLTGNAYGSALRRVAPICVPLLATMDGAFGFQHQPSQLKAALR